MEKNFQEPKLRRELRDGRAEEDGASQEQFAKDEVCVEAGL